MATADRGLTAAIATWVSALATDRIPDAAYDLAAIAIRDCVGVALAGSRSPQARAVQHYVTAVGGTPEAYVWGTRLRTAAPMAALANGTAAHALDFDDTNHPLYGHPSSQLVPPLLSLAERRRSSGRDLIAAYLIGFEVEVRLARAMNMAHYLAGWHATSTIGTIGSAAACARLLGLDQPSTMHTLGVAASLASGLRVNFGTMTKPLHAGQAAMNGVQAASLALLGFTAAGDAIEGRHGYLDVFGVSGDTPEIDAAAFGEPWEILQPVGLAIKQFPSCGATHPAIEAAMALHRRLNGDLERVQHVTVGVGPWSERILRYPQPKTGLEAKFSMHYCVAAALVRGKLGIFDFEPEGLSDPQVERLRGRTSMEEDARVATSEEFAAVVTCHLADGSVVSERVDLARGKTARPLSESELSAKFRDCAGVALGAQGVARSLSMLGDLRNLDDITPLAMELSA